MTKSCKNCGQSFEIAPDDLAFYEKIDVPEPTWCWKCRAMRRMSWRNERKAFWNTSAKSGKKIISIYPQDSGMTVFDEKEWRADDWSGLDYGRDYDFSRSFFEQIMELFKKVPVNGPHTEDNVNCDYLVCTGWSKNCYLVSNSSRAEDSAYGNAMDDSKTCFDDSHITKCERCYGSFWIRESYQTHFSTRSISNTSCIFCFGTKGMTNCFGCVNMMNKSYCIFNKQYSKDDYKEKIKAMKLNTWSGLQKAKAGAEAFASRFPIAYLNGVLNDDVTGEYISNSKNVHFGYLINGGKDLKYCQYLQVPGAEDSMDLTVWGESNVRAYENSTSGLGVSNSHFLKSCWSEVVNSEYCMDCRGISDCFGCVGLKQKQYCIFNKQYSPSEYAELISKIKSQMSSAAGGGEYGEFFPPKYAPFGYNVTMAQEHFPLTREQAVAKGYPWYDAPPKEYKTTMTAAQIPDAIEDVKDSILKEVLECIECQKAYRIIEMELAFLRQEKLPIPRQCIDCRHNGRIRQRAGMSLYHRQCGCNLAKHFHGDAPCPNEFETAYPPTDPRFVYCLRCFYDEIA